MEPSASDQTAVVLFSGGSSSSLAAIRAGMRFEHVRLLTVVRRGITGLERVREQAARLGRFFGDEQKVSLQVVPAGRLFRKVSTHHHLRSLWRHGFAALAPCGPCRVTFHWRALVYCLEHGFEHLLDGAVQDARHPEQGEAVLTGPLRELHQAFGITYETPIAGDGAGASAGDGDGAADEVDELLHELRFHRAPRVRGTAQDHKLLCRQHVLQRAFLRRVDLPRDAGALEQKLAALLAPRLALAREWTREWQDRGAGSRLERLIER